MILEALAECGSLHATEIVDEIDKHPITVDRACARLHQVGQIHSIGCGHYRLTNCGEQRLDDGFS